MIAKRMIAAMVMLLGGCGGRVGRPLPATTPYDSRLDCAHLQAEKAVNAARAHDLAGEQRNDVGNNIGFLVFSPLFLNLSGSEQTEIRAFAAREVVLDRLMVTACAAPAAAPPPAAP